MCTIAPAKVQRNYNCYNVYFNECLRRMGISQSLMAQYISGKKKASAERVANIYKAVREVGQELIAV